MKSLWYLFLITIFLLTGCSGGSLKPDNQYAGKIDSDFETRRSEYITGHPDLFSVFDNKLSADENLSMKFIYAYMPLSDLADYDGDFFLANTRLALETRVDKPWGEEIPAELFLHFILPLRVNNENLDSFRIKYYDEIANRVANFKNAEEAALEINHWCHEKVIYQSSDSRTSSPVYTILSARGRCGEESTFTVAALRCAGIPARQVYTPRWAHSDDNHAWVEVWVNGTWKYLGACEPEPVLDRGWFTEPARRAMLIHTKTFGAYSGNEPTTYKKKSYSEINNLAKYAVTKDLTVSVVSENGDIQANTLVEFQLYNYAEFYPIATIPTDENGFATLETGLGDLIVWARSGEAFDFSFVSVADHDSVRLVLNDGSAVEGKYEFDITAPLARTPFPGIPDELVQLNNRRLAREDSIRQVYINGWISDDNASNIVTEMGYDAETVIPILKSSMGNYREILKFLENSAVNPDRAIDLLSVIAEKDLRDAPSAILINHLKNSLEFDNGEFPDSVFIPYIFSPRIANELITPWRSAIKTSLADKKGEFKSNPSAIGDWIAENLTLNEDDNYYGVPLSPAGVLKIGETDIPSRKILFVAICRAFGIPSRLEPGTTIPQYFYGGSWVDIFFGEEGAVTEKYLHDATVTFIYNGDLPVPEYYIHFTLAKFENGRYNTLRYQYNSKVTDFSEPLNLSPGRYMLVTGNRTDDSHVYASADFFNLAPGEEKKLDISLRKVTKEKIDLGKINMELLSTIKGSDALNFTELNNRLVIAWVDINSEPTTHLLNDLSQLKPEFDGLGTRFLILTDTSVNSKILGPEQLSTLPVNIVSGNDTGGELLNKLFENSQNEGNLFPYIICADSDGNILFRSSGYRIGIGEQIIKSIK